MQLLWARYLQKHQWSSPKLHSMRCNAREDNPMHPRTRKAWRTAPLQKSLGRESLWPQFREIPIPGWPGANFDTLLEPCFKWFHNRFQMHKRRQWFHFQLLVSLFLVQCRVPLFMHWAWRENRHRKNIWPHSVREPVLLGGERLWWGWLEMHRWQPWSVLEWRTQQVHWWQQWNQAGRWEGRLPRWPDVQSQRRQVGGYEDLPDKEVPLRQPYSMSRRGGRGGVWAAVLEKRHIQKRRAVHLQCSMLGDKLRR